MKLKTRIRNKTLNETVFNNRKLSSVSIVSIILLTSLTATIIFIPSVARGDITPPTQYINLLPDGEGNTQQWKYMPADPRSHYDKVDDPVGKHDDDETYVYADKKDMIEDFNHETSALLNGATISNVRVVVRARVEKAKSAQINIGVRIAGTWRYSSGAIATLTSSYSVNFTDWFRNPHDEDPWSKEDIDGLQSSINTVSLEGEGSQIIVTQVYINVTYKPSTTLDANVDWGNGNKINGASYVISANNSTGTIANYTWTLGNGTKIYAQSWITLHHSLACVDTINLTISDSTGKKSYEQAEVTIKQYISVVKNSNNNGVNYVTWGANNSIMASKLATDLNLGNRDYIEKFDPGSGAWDIVYDVQDKSGDFEISRWDHIMIDLENSSQASYSFTPGGIDTPHDVTMSFTENNKGYNYITWSEDHVVTPADFITALKTAKQIKTGEDITIYVYNPTTNNWASYNPNIPEVFNTLSSIQPYDVICFHAPNHRDVRYKPGDW